MMKSISVYANTPPNLVPNRPPTLGNLLREHGYHTVYKGKFHMDDTLNARNSHEGGTLSRWDALQPFGFSEWSEQGDFWGKPQEGYAKDAQFAEQAAAWLRRRRRRDKNVSEEEAMAGSKEADEDDACSNKPWLLAVNFINPHDIMWFRASEAQEETRDKALLPRARFLPAPSLDDEMLYAQKWGCEPYTCEGEVLPDVVSRSVDFVNRRYGRFPTAAEHQANVDYYINCLRDVDRHIGTVLRALDENDNMRENTIVIFTSDHGEMLGDHGLRQKGGWVYKENIGVPFLVRRPMAMGSSKIEGPAGAPHKACEEKSACQLDLVPTILGLCGVRDWPTRYPWLRGADLFSSPSRLVPGQIEDDIIHSRFCGDVDLNGAVLFQFGHDRSAVRGGFLQLLITDRWKFGRYFGKGAAFGNFGRDGRGGLRGASSSLCARERPGRRSKEGRTCGSG